MPDARLRPGSRLAFLAALPLLLLQLGATGTTPAPEQAWLPLDPGTRWIYTLTRNRETRTGPFPPQTEILHGRVIDEMRPSPPQLGENVLEVHSTIEESIGDMPQRMHETMRSFLIQERSSLRMVAQEVPDPLSGRNRLFHFTPPLEMLGSDLDEGYRWDVGVMAFDGIEVHMRGEVVGIEDVETPAGLFEACLVVRYTGQVKGSADAFGTPVRVTEGKMVSTEWYARGVGKVRMEEELAQTMELANGATMSYRELAESQLESVARGVALPASPEPLASSDPLFPVY
ncbi:MAG: hypothetical protein MJE66_12675 [Proteobacteria bacterium]|nr:hypothetical protein [Pseudomonadota bacterium]